MLGALMVYVKPVYGNWVFGIAIAAWLAGWLYTFEKAKHKTWFFLWLLGMVISIWFTLQLTFVQNAIVSTVSGKLSDNLKAKVSIQRIDYSFFDKMDLRGLLVEDRQRDTLLYAGSAKINITDWFFLKNKATLKYVALTNAVVNMQRTDSVWNYQFLVDYFSSPKKSSGKKNTIEFDIKILKLENIRFSQLDRWVGHNMEVHIKKLDLFADDISLDNKKINLNTLSIDGPEFGQFDYEGNRERLHIPKDTSRPDAKTTAYRWNNAGWIMNVKNIHITNGVFSSGQETARAPFTDRFDGAHLRFGNITGDFNNLHFEKDTLTTDFSLSTKERSGFEVKKLKAALKFTPELMEYKQLELVTNKSHLGNYFAMHYRGFNKDMSDFVHSIKMDANFVNSELSSDDLGFFAPETKEWKRVFQLKGVAKGSVDNLAAKKMLIKTDNSYVDGDIALKGLPDIDNTFIDFQANELKTTIRDLSAIVPSLKTVTQPNLGKLGNINYRGNFTGFIKDFVAFGTISTNLGVVTGDVNMKLPDDGSSVYIGKISTDGFQLGEFINSKDVGKIIFNGKLNGAGFSSKDVAANFDGNIRSVEVAGYTYQNIAVKGDFGKKLFSGSASIDDPNLVLHDLKGSIDFTGTEPQFNFDADLTKADFKKLNITQDDFLLNGHFNLDFTGSNIDNFLGTAKIYNAGLLHNNTPLSFDSLILHSSVLNDSKVLSLVTNNLEAEVDGKFTIRELPDAFKIFLSRYFPSYIKKPGYTLSDQDFSFLIKTKEVDGYMPLLDHRLRGFDNAVIEGSLQLSDNQFSVNVTVPQFSYDGKVFNNTRLASNGNFDDLVTKADVDDVQINDSLHLPTSSLVLDSHDDITDIVLNTSASKNLSSANINAQVQTMKDGVKIHFFPSSFIINDKKWQLERDGELSLSKTQVSASEVNFVQGDQQIKIATEPSETGNTNDVVVKLTKVSIDDLLPLVLKKPRMEGQISGTVRIADPFGKPYIEADAETEKFTIDGDSVGVINTHATYSTNTGIVKFNAGAEDPNNHFRIDGTYNTKDSLGNQADIAIVSEKLDLKILNNYLGGIFSEIRGTANTSNLRVMGNSKHLTITGSANVTEGSLRVIYTQCKYAFKNETIIFNPDEIDFGTVTITDTLNNTATVSGKMYHRFFDQVGFDNVKMDTKKLLVLNTTKRDNNIFYGKVIGRASLVLNGSADDITMDINGEPSRTDSSHIYLSNGTTVESGVVDYIDFIQFGTEMANAYKGRISSNIVVNMALTANPSCKIDVILDEATGDIIKGEGNGLLKIRVGNKEPLTINGRYDITRGDYTFNFQTYLKKYFKVNTGNIVWSGDPLNAQIDIIAEYLATNVDFKSISNNISGTTGTNTSFQKKSDVRVLAHLTESLLKPSIDFEFQLPPGSPLANDFFITKTLQQYKDDKNELNKQVTSLLLFNSFISGQQGFITANSGANILSSTIGGMVSSALSGYFNKFLQKYLKNTSLYFDLNTSYGSTSPGDLQANVAQLQAAAKSGLIFTLLQGRLIISAGVNVDYNNPYAINYTRNTNVLVTPDVTAEFIINKDGSVRVVAFNRTNYDFIGQRNKTGVNLSYRKDFDKLSDILDPKRKRKVVLVNNRPVN
ncbi:translocation/assembly module TamB domain-containing protein [Ferruginibacter paludis]|uniref:translocation/assembly module TamB domain-containing protein n=1 Tax=Ferruginibacter paludis TaxID=1310417 RepID=UPI0025B28567|nr:translocation/assembly module TamB domain-containing protein [Ferruginibacter paludis]MDN3655116.1 translocation/assembly module TamB domain-containing protein [Ferruginibacter paludis]